ncbi:hypothetical protein OKW52_08580 [Pararhodobacter zhoushanensis]|uniref:Uncharacterized protein n=1 Tax=Pararhodobacter zhoushanensis TaxID=2479545 RepID=A0ABT3GXX2_9RHOB|nr:hypothetical protein [Pararhodobacter zhoushanensis]
MNRAPFRPAPPQQASVDPSWRAARLAEARSVIAAAAHHSDHLVRIACEVVIRHGASATERKDARALCLVVDARRPLRHAQLDAQRRDLCPVDGKGDRA